MFHPVSPLLDTPRLSFPSSMKLLFLLQNSALLSVLTFCSWRLLLFRHSSSVPCISSPHIHSSLSVHPCDASCSVTCYVTESVCSRFLVFFGLLLIVFVLINIFKYVRLKSSLLHDFTLSFWGFLRTIKCYMNCNLRSCLQSF